MFQALENNLKLAEIGKVADIPSALGEMQSALDLATLEESKEQAEGESKLAQEDGKAYAHNMNESFGKQLVSLLNYFCRVAVTERKYSL